MAKEQNIIQTGNITSKVVIVNKDNHSYNLIILESGSDSLTLRTTDIPKAILALSKTYEYLTLSEPKDTISEKALLNE